MTYTIAIADDETDLLEAVAEYFEGHGFDVLTATDAVGFRAIVQERGIHLAILDIAMPGEDGLSLARWLRRSSRAGIIFASASGSPMDRIVGLEIGADDYVSKPYDMRELLARVRSLLRRLDQAAPAATTAPPGGTLPASRQVRFGPFTLDPQARRLRHRDAGEIDLTAAEFELLAALGSRPNRILSRTRLNELLGLSSSEADSDRRIDVRMTRLRRKIEPDPDRPRFIRTIRGEGYVLSTDDPG
ncbi:response regulator transcription factor [Rubellimicrobium arenae]|uniref:response regulator transcription factor n=1 Tax=Rubellimicrobium arenae TaxID=2817372 RepID=UPI001B302929|nr:response regulator transcription factor [Rubellimicrobium arenae]